MSEEIHNILKGFVKFQEDEQLKRAKEMERKFEQMNTPTLEWILETCREILKRRKTRNDKQ